jgi:hypothetical protein
MRIFYAGDSDPMLVDREPAGLHAFGRELGEFLDTARESAEFLAETTGDPTPYSEFLPGLRVRKAEDGPPGLQVGSDRWLEVTATPTVLRELCGKLARVTGAGHTHFYAGGGSLILEADDSWPGFHED